MFLERHAEFEAWNFGQEVIWEKQNGSSLHTDRFRLVHENIWQFYPKTAKWADLYRAKVVSMDAQARRVRRQQKPAHWGQLASAGEYTVEEGGPRLMRSVVYCKNEHRKALHPTQKPETVIAPLILSSCPDGGLVLDPFTGCGSVLAAAKQLGRRAIGIESQEIFCEQAAHRLSQEVLGI